MSKESAVDKFPFQMDELIDKLIEIIKEYSGVSSSGKKCMSMDNAKRYIEFLNGLRYKNIGRKGGSLQPETVFKKISNLINGKNQPDNRKFSYVLGAGVSNDFGIPNWEELVYRINFSKYWQNMYGESSSPKTFYDNECYYDLKCGLFRLNSNLYEWAQYSENNFILDEKEKESNFCVGIPSEVIEKKLDNVYYSVVKQTLYYKIDRLQFYLYDINKMRINRKKFHLHSNLTTEVKDSIKLVKNLKYTSKTTLGLICQIAKKKKLERIITYNYDDCFEYCWERIGCAKFRRANPCLPIFDKQQLYENSTPSHTYRCDVYHVHGFIPFLSGFEKEKNKFNKRRKDQYEAIRGAAESYDGKKLILSEVSYDDIQDEIYKWRNDVQVDTLLRYSCIFVGFSATDINFKRIVKQITRIKKERVIEESPEHFITICLDDYIRSFYYGDSKIKGVDDFLEKLTTEADKLYPYIISTLEMLMDRNNYLVRYGIYPLFTTISDLPKLLKEIAK